MAGPRPASRNGRSNVGAAEIDSKPPPLRVYLARFERRYPVDSQFTSKSTYLAAIVIKLAAFFADCIS